MKTRKEWTTAKEKAGLEMPKRGKPDIGPNLEKLGRLKGKDPEALLRLIEKGLDLYEGVPENSTNAKAKALLASMRIDVGLAREEADTLAKAKLVEANRKEYAAMVAKEEKAFKGLSVDKVLASNGLKREFQDYAARKEFSGDLVEAAILWREKKYKHVAETYGGDDTWNQGEAGRALYGHYTGAAVLPSDTEVRNHIFTVDSGFEQMVWSDSSQSLFGRWKKNPDVIKRVVALKLAKVRKQLGLEDDE